MNNQSRAEPLIVIVGPTASGKTALSIEIARLVGGEIVCADSRTMYRELDIGTAKPTRAEQAEIAHHVLDVASPDQVISAAYFKTLATQAMDQIWRRGHTPIMVGGSGLYVDSVIYDYTFPEPMNPNQRAALSSLSLADLQQQLQALDPATYAIIDIKNPRRIIRAIETAGVGGSRAPHVRADTLVLGIPMNKEIIRERIQKRVALMLEEGFLDEVSRIAAKYGWDCPALSGIGYRAFRGVIEGHDLLDVGIQAFAHGDYLLAKRQMTWFKRNPEIIWIQDMADCITHVKEFMGSRILNP